MSVEITDGGRTVTYICEWCGLTSKDDCEFVDIGWSVKDGKYIPGDELVCVVCATPDGLVTALTNGTEWKN